MQSYALTRIWDLAVPMKKQDPRWGYIRKARNSWNGFWHVDGFFQRQNSSEVYGNEACLTVIVFLFWDSVLCFHQGRLVS